MQLRKFGEKYLIKLEKDEKIITTLTKFCQDEEINFGTISAIGAVSQITLGWYELKTKSYHWQDFNGSLEIISLSGNISLLDSKPFLHIHTVISNESFQAFGGHLKEAQVGATLEVIIEKIAGEIIRQMDEKIGLNLLDLG